MSSPDNGADDVAGMAISLEDELPQGSNEHPTPSGARKVRASGTKKVRTLTLVFLAALVGLSGGLAMDRYSEQSSSEVASEAPQAGVSTSGTPHGLPTGQRRKLTGGSFNGKNWST